MRIIIATTVLLLSLMATQALATPFQNGSFEDIPHGWGGLQGDIAAWSFNSIDLVASDGRCWAAQNGYFSIDLNGVAPGSI